MVYTIGCPCCGDPMDSNMVVCWVCYRWTDRLTPGSYDDMGFLNMITAADIAEWDAARDGRC